MKRTLTFASMLLAGTALAMPSVAQDDSVQVLSSWSYDPLYKSGRSVEWMIDNTTLLGANGDEIGGVENVIFSDDGQALALIAEVGGFWDIGDTHVSIPWEQVEIGNDADQIMVPVTEENVGDYYFTADAFLGKAEIGSVQEVDDDLTTGQSLFKATDLIGDYSYTENSNLYGYVNDILVGESGQIDAIVVDGQGYGRPGFYAYPYDRTVNPMGPGYELPFGIEQLGELDNFDYDELQSAS